MEQTAKPTKKERIQELEKKLESETSSLNYARTSRDEAQKEINELHCILDGIPQAPRRKVKDESSYSNERELTVGARVAGLMAGLIHVQFPPSSKKYTVEREEG